MSKENRFAVANLTLGQLNAIVKKLGGQEEALRFLRGTPENKGNSEDSKEALDKKNSTISFCLTSIGKTGKEWIEYFKSKGVIVLDQEKEFLLSNDFLPEKKGTRYNVVVMKGEIFPYRCSMRRMVIAEANRRGYKIPPSELACLIRDKFSNGDIELMGLKQITVMHKPGRILDRDYWDLLNIDSTYGETSYLSSNPLGPEDNAYDNDGFAFIL